MSGIAGSYVKRRYLAGVVVGCAQISSPGAIEIDDVPELVRDVGVGKQAGSAVLRRALGVVDKIAGRIVGEDFPGEHLAGGILRKNRGNLADGIRKRRRSSDG